VTNSIVSVRSLKKQFGKNEILHGLDFDIPPGRIYGLVGHNGAGKTTTLNAMLGLTSYEGSVQVLGQDPYAHRASLMKDVAFISDVCEPCRASSRCANCFRCSPTSTPIFRARRR
jgi:ABC-2 type transport system ATP-binding protein